MEFKQLLSDGRAVSPVIGVILMVAITVILAAVVGTFVLGLGNNLGDTAPNANFDFEYGEENDGDYNVTSTHSGGATISTNNAGNLTLTAAEFNGTDGTVAFDIENGTSTGDSVSIDDVAAGSDVRVIWTSQDGGNSQALAEGSAPT